MNVPPSAPDQADAPPPKFDQYAQDYVALHAKNIAITGEAPEYFAQYKLVCLERLVGTAASGLNVLDYGCGVGMLTRQLVGRFAEVHGYDPSLESLHKAAAEVPGARFHAHHEEAPDGSFDLVVLSGVLHHIPPAERDLVMARVRAKLRPETGRVVVFEHNPLNPLTRRVVATCAYDDDAILLWPWQATALLGRNGFADVRRDFIVFFPRFLGFLRPLEPTLRHLPVGGQMMLVGRRTY